MKNLGYLSIKSPGKADMIRYLPVATTQDELSDFDFYANKHTEDDFILGFEANDAVPLFISQVRDMDGFIPMEMDLADTEVIDFFFKDRGKVRKQYQLVVEVLVDTKV